MALLTRVLAARTACVWCTSPLGGRPGKDKTLAFLRDLLRWNGGADDPSPPPWRLLAAPLSSRTAFPQARSLVNQQLAYFSLSRHSESPAPLPPSCTSSRKTVKDDWRVSLTYYTSSGTSAAGMPVYAYRYDVINEPVLEAEAEENGAKVPVFATLIRCWEKEAPAAAAATAIASAAATTTTAAGPVKRSTPASPPRPTQPTTEALAADQRQYYEHERKRLRALEERVQSLERAHGVQRHAIPVRLAAEEGGARINPARRTADDMQSLLADIHAMLGGSGDGEQSSE